MNMSRAWKRSGAGTIVVLGMLVSGTATAQPAGWEYRMRRAKPDYGGRSDSKQGHPQWLRAARHLHPGAFDPVQFSGSEGQAVRRPVSPPEVPHPARNVSAPNEGAVAVLDLEQLASELPRTVQDLHRVPEPGDPEPTAGTGIRQRYTNDDGSRRVTVSLHDMEGEIPGTNKAEIMHALSSSFHQETAEGYIRTLDIQGCKAIERLDRTTDTVEISLLVGSRIGVVIQGQGVGRATVQAAIAQLNLPRLTALGS